MYISTRSDYKQLGFYICSASVCLFSYFHRCLVLFSFVFFLFSHYDTSFYLSELRTRKTKLKNRIYNYAHEPHRDYTAEKI